MTNSDIATIFQNISNLLKIQSEEPDYRAQIYLRAAEAIEELETDINKLYAEGKLQSIPGVGEAISQKIAELIETGRMAYYNRLQAAIPIGVLDLLALSGVGHKTAGLLYRNLGIDGLDALDKAIAEGKLKGIKGMGTKTITKIKEGLEFLKRRKFERPLFEILPQAEAICRRLVESNRVARAVIAGDIRRKADIVKGIDIVAEHADSTSPLQSPNVNIDFPLRIHPASASHFDAAMLYYTGSEAHIRELNRRAMECKEPIFEEEGENPPFGKGGIFAAWTAGKSEAEIYTALEMPFIPPELREDRGEIDAALAGKLPCLIELGEVRGDLHAHTDWSDGVNTIAEMAHAARERGYEYIVISDHSRSLKVANGLSIERLTQQIDAVREANEHSDGIAILIGTEVDILKDGHIDYPDGILAELDIVTASVHSHFNLDEVAMTKRIIKAIEHPQVQIIGHLTGRLLHRRPAYAVNLDAILEAAAANNVALEINAHPHRLDLNDDGCRQAKERNVMIAINSDAHSIAELKYMAFGIDVARRGWLAKENVLNALPLADLAPKLNES